MSEINVLRVAFGALRTVTAKPRYRDDCGQILEIVGITNLPENFQAHFSCDPRGNAAIPMLGTNHRVEIPNALFAFGMPIYCWIVVQNLVTDRRVVYEIKIPVRQKARPSGEVIPSQADALSQAIAALDNAKDNAAINAAAAQEAADSVAQNAEYIAGVKDDLDDAIERVGVLEQAKESTLEAAGNAEAWAVGKRGGSAVPSTDPAYHNNAKYYAEQAAASAQKIIIDDARISGLDLSHYRLQATPIASDAHWMTNYFHVDGGSNVTINAIKQANTQAICLYDEDLRQVQSVTNQTMPYTFDLSPYACYARMCFSANADIPNDYFTYNTKGKSKSVYSGIIEYVGSSSTVFNVDVTGDFKANDIVSCQDAVCVPSIIPYDKEQTVRVKVDRTLHTASNQAVGWVATHFTVTNVSVDSINVSSSGDDNSNETVATLARAFASGAKIINILSDIVDVINTQNRDVTINGNGHFLFGSVPLTTEEYEGILRAAYEADERITNCYVNKTKALKEYPSGSSWKGGRFGIACFADDVKLEPFETIAEVEENENSFCWSEGYFYINATGTRISYVKYSSNNFVGGTVTINDLNVSHYYGNVCAVKSGGVLNVNGCRFCGSVQENALYSENSTLNADKCEATVTWNDGINCHGRGKSTIVNCFCHDCSDDGISQHDNTIGTIIGGEFCRNQKGGISSPINAAKVDIYNAYVHDNRHSTYGYGIYAAKSSSDPVEYKVFGCVIKNNRIGLDNAGHYALLYGNHISGNTTNVFNQMSGTVTYLDQ